MTPSQQREYLQYISNVADTLITLGKHKLAAQIRRRIRYLKLKTWLRYHLLGEGKCKTCRGTGKGKPFGDSELLGLNAYFKCDDCKGTGEIQAPKIEPEEYPLY